jgi:peptidoglycan hydrolase-like protein with peptidoglycan-binding domain
MQGLRNQISVLEAQLASRDEEIAGLKDSLNQAKEIASKPQPQEKAIGEVKSRPNTKQIQTALANAGYYAGKVDGKMGRQTRSAIKEFQRANNLKPDGKVGKQTWAVLQEFLYKKVK